MKVLILKIIRTILGLPLIIVFFPICFVLIAWVYLLAFIYACDYKECKSFSDNCPFWPHKFLKGVWKK